MSAVPISLSRRVVAARIVDRLKVASASRRDHTPAANQRETEADLAPLLEAILGQFQAIRLRDTQLTSRVQFVIVEVATAIAERVIRQEVEAERFGIEALVEEALETLSGDAAKISLSPKDLDLLKSRAAPDWQNELSEQNVVWVADPQLSRGNCMVTTEIESMLHGIESDLPALKKIVTAHLVDNSHAVTTHD